MSKLFSELLAEQEKLNESQAIIEERMKGAPPGKLRVSTSHGHTQYYYCLDFNDRKGKYLSQKQTDLIRLLSQKEYDIKVLSYINSRLGHIKKLLSVYNATDIQKYYQNLIPARQKWITPINPLWEDALKQWIDIPYTGMGFSPQDPVLRTNHRKIRMRSKSELQLGNYFEDKGILYKYECPLQLSSYGIIYPDFTFLSPYTLQDIYLEHLGIMDNSSYSSKTVDKIKSYERDHIFPGERLFLTYETDKNKLDMDIVEEIANKYLIFPKQQH